MTSKYENPPPLKKLGMFLFGGMVVSTVTAAVTDQPDLVYVSTSSIVSLVFMALLVLWFLGVGIYMVAFERGADVTNPEGVAEIDPFSGVKGLFAPTIVQNRNVPPTVLDALVRLGDVGAEALESAVRKAQAQGVTPEQVMLDDRIISTDQLARANAEKHGLDFIDLNEFEIDLAVATRISREEARSFEALPVHQYADGSVLVAMVDPGNLKALDDLKLMLRKELRPAITSPEDLSHALTILPISSVSDLVSGQERAEPLRIGAPDIDPNPRDAGLFAPTLDRGGCRPPTVLDALVRLGYVGALALENAVAQARTEGVTPEQWLLGNEVITSDEFARAVAETSGLYYIDLSVFEVDRRVATSVAADVLKRCQALPVKQNDDGSVLVATADPSNHACLDEIKLLLGVDLRLAVATTLGISRALSQL